jgi:hypothetical protein
MAGAGCPPPGFAPAPAAIHISARACWMLETRKASTSERCSSTSCASLRSWRSSLVRRRSSLHVRMKRQPFMLVKQACLRLPSNACRTHTQP